MRLSPRDVVARFGVVKRNAFIGMLACLVGVGGVLFTGSPLAHASTGLAQAQACTVAITDAQQGIYGSGVIIAPEWVLTARHVIEATDLHSLDKTLQTSEDKSYSYEIHHVSGHDDLALLHVQGLRTPVIPLRSTGILAAGEDVYALGYPLGLSTMSVTKGIVSAPLQRVEGFEFVQTDASINPGNSGGPLVDGSGRLVGLNVMKAASSDIDNMGFAVPLANIERFLEGTPVGETLSAAAAVSGGATAGGGQQPDTGGLLLVLLVLAGLGVSVAIVHGSRRPLAAVGGTAGLDAPGELRAEKRSVVLRVESAATGVATREVQLPAIVGRDVVADVPVEDVQVSRQHARLTWADDGSVVVRDLSSRNGIEYEGELRGSFTLSKGACFRVGGTMIRRIA